MTNLRGLNSSHDFVQQHNYAGFLGYIYAIYDIFTAVCACRSISTSFALLISQCRCEEHVFKK